MKDEDGFKPARESTHLSLPTRYELANGFTSIPSRLLGDLEEKHLPQTFSIATRVAHDGIRIVVTSVRIALSNLKVQHLKDLLESRCSCSGASTYQRSWWKIPTSCRKARSAASVEATRHTTPFGKTRTVL